VKVKWKGYEKIGVFRPIFRFISKNGTRHTAIVAMEDEYELVCDLSNGAISNDLE